MPNYGNAASKLITPRKINGVDFDGTQDINPTSGPSLSSATPQVIGSATAGTSGSASRSDHVHAGGTVLALSDATPQPVGTGTAGTSGSASRSDHVHSGGASGGVALANATPQAIGTAAAGTSGSASRSDHIHAGTMLSGDTPATIIAVGTVGTSGSAARGDHVHGFSFYSSTTPAASAATGAVGTSGSAARSDHTHGFNLYSGTAPAMVNGASVVGTSGSAARSDHVHGFSFYSSTNPAALGTVSPGTSGSAARSDHVHADPFLAKLRLASDVSGSSTSTPVNLTNMVFSYAANSYYIFDMYMLCTSGSATTGYNFAVDVSSAVTSVGLIFVHQLANAGTLSGGSSIADNTRTGSSSGVAGNNTLSPIMGHGILITAGNTGTAQFTFSPEVNALATCKAGSIIVVANIA
jgi:hypothetical protein